MIVVALAVSANAVDSMRMRYTTLKKPGLCKRDGKIMILIIHIIIIIITMIVTSIVIVVIMIIIIIIINIVSGRCS